MKAGQFRSVVIVQTPTTIQDSNGDDTTDWSNIVGTWKAKIEPLSVREEFLAEQQRSSATHRVSFRYRPELAAMTGKERIVFGDRIFVLTGLPTNIDQRNRDLEFLCLEGLRES